MAGWRPWVGRGWARYDKPGYAQHSHPPATTFDKPCIYIYNKQPTSMRLSWWELTNPQQWSLIWMANPCPLNLSLLQFFDFDLPSWSFFMILPCDPTKYDLSLWSLIHCHWLDSSSSNCQQCSHLMYLHVIVRLFLPFIAFLFVIVFNLFCHFVAKMNFKSSDGSVAGGVKYTNISLSPVWNDQFHNLNSESQIFKVWRYLPSITHYKETMSVCKDWHILHSPI